MSRKKYIVGNWKMFKNLNTSSQDFLELLTSLKDKKINADIGVCPPFIFLNELTGLRAKETSSSHTSHIDIYAQNAHWEKEGAFTGEISAPMLKSVHVDGSLIAHSERRQYFGETNKSAGKRLNAVLTEGLKAIYCVGESLQEREENKVKEVIESQLKEALAECKNLKPEHFIGEDNSSPLFSIAYEPVWAIGTGRAATPLDAHEVHVFIREQLSQYFDKEFAQKIRILYGGSVKPANVHEFLKDLEIDGALVGGASLNPKDFLQLL